MKVAIICMTVLSLFGCASQQSISVASNSEMEYLMNDLNSTGRLYQNKPRINYALAEYEKGTECKDLEVVKLVEPGKQLSGLTYIYEVVAHSVKCGDLTYQTEIKFKDSSRTLIKSFVVIHKNT